MCCSWERQATNHRAIHFYQKHGFRKVGTFEHPAGQFNHDMILDLLAPPGGLAAFSL